MRSGDAASAYALVLDTLANEDVPFLVGGGVALASYTGVDRGTKDLDLFLRPADFDPAMRALADAGFVTERTHPHWLGKARAGKYCIDLIFNSGNGMCEVDDEWFEHAGDASVLGRTVRMVPAEELAWTKLFIMERERYDGADVAHLLRDLADRFDWQRLLERVGANWRVLLSHLVLFGYIYPAERAKIPQWLLDELLRRLQLEREAASPRQRLCRGTLLSRQQYLHDIRAENYRDARNTRASSMTPRDIAAWTDAIDRDRERYGDKDGAGDGDDDRPR
jgi:hypothetical protein